LTKKRRPKKHKAGVKAKRSRRNVEGEDFFYKESGRKSPTLKAKLEQWEKRQKGVPIFQDYEGRMRTETEFNLARYAPDGDTPST